MPNSPTTSLLQRQVTGRQHDMITTPVGKARTRQDQTLCVGVFPDLNVSNVIISERRSCILVPLGVHGQTAGQLACHPLHALAHLQTELEQGEDAASKVAQHLRPSHAPCVGSQQRICAQQHAPPWGGANTHMTPHAKQAQGN